MSLEAKIFKGVSWMAFFNFFSQCVSWTITVLIARILLPSDYGLMAMSTIITGYALNLSDIGLGNAIIQRPQVSKNELSSVFWFTIGIAFLLAASCIPISYLTAYIMHEPRVIPVTQVVALVFILNGLQIVPSSILRKEMNFKAIGKIDMISVIVSSGFMLIIAKAGGGVWTLIMGYLIKSLIRTILLFVNSKWYPNLHYNFKESKHFLSFGILVAIGRSLFYVQEKSDKFFAGRAWNSKILGFYTFAQDLAQIPIDKIVSLINNVSFPAFAKAQDNKEHFNSLYLNITKVTAMVVLPIYVGGFFLGENIIRILLNPKWYPMVTVFKFLCLAQILTGMNAINNFVHAAQGRPNWALYYNIAGAVIMPVSFYFATQRGLNDILVPWFSSYVLLTVGWIIISLLKLGIPIRKYLSCLAAPVSATALMALGLYFFLHQNIPMPLEGKIADYIYLSLGFSVGVAVYIGYTWFVEKKFIMNIRKLIGSGDVD